MAGAGGIIQEVKRADKAQPQGKSVTWVLIDQRMRSIRFYLRPNQGFEVSLNLNIVGNGTQICAERAGSTQITQKLWVD
jgi:hypothetical protein